VPQMHLSCFANANNQVCVYQKGKLPRWTAVAKTATERDFHEFSIGDSKSDFQFEDTLANIENRAARVRQKMIKRVAASQDDIAIWALFVASTFLRTRKVRKNVSSRLGKEVARELRSHENLLEIQYQFLKRGTIVPLAEVENRVGKQLDVILASPAFLHLSGFHTNMPSLAHSICQKVWHIVEAGGSSSFLTSDCPVTTAQIRDRQLFLGYGFGLPTTTVFFAIDTKHLFIATPPQVNWAAFLDPSDVNMINLMTIQYADREVYANEESEEIQRSVQENINQVVFGEHAYISKRDLAPQ